jgi:hypothetical protein
LGVDIPEVRAPLEDLLHVCLLPSLFFNHFLPLQIDELNHKLLDIRQVFIHLRNQGKVGSELTADGIGLLYLLNGEVVGDRNAMLLLEMNELISGSLAVGEEMYEGVEEQMSDDFEVGDAVWK